MRCLSAALSLAVLLVSEAVFPAEAKTKETVTFEGTGTQSDPYQIGSAADLQNLASLINLQAELDSAKPGLSPGETVFAMTNDIDLAEVCENSDWVPIGRDATSSGGHTTYEYFRYIFEGNNHTISNLKIVSTMDRSVGLFGCVGGSAVIRNLYLDETCLIVNTANCTGGLIGVIRDTTDGTVLLDHVGIRTSVTGNSQTGGLFGRLDNTNIQLYVKNCYVAGPVSASSSSPRAFGRVDLGSTNKVNYENCHYLNGMAGTNSSHYPSGTGVFGHSEAEFLSGSVAYALGAGWGQVLPNEWPKPGGPAVYLDSARTVYYNMNRIYGVSLTLSADLTVRYICYLDEDHKDADMTFTWQNRTSAVAGDAENGGRYVYSFRGVCPQCMTDNLKAELTLGGTVLDGRDTFCVAEYCAKRLAKTEDPEEKTLLVDLIDYGAAAQVYANYRTEALADQYDAYRTAKEASGATGTGSSPVLAERGLVGDRTANGSGWISATLYFDYCCRLSLRFRADSADVGTDSVTVVEVRDGNSRTYGLSDFTAAEDGTYRLRTDPVSVCDFGKEFTYALMIGDRTVQSLTYGIGVWCYTVGQEGSTYGVSAKRLAVATYRYGYSAGQYAN